MTVEIASLGGETMGTTWGVHMVAPRKTDLRLHHRRIESLLQGLVQEMSTWEADSVISRFNRAEPGSVHQLPADFAHVLTCAIEIAAQSDGAFDPTVGDLVGVWGFGAHARRPDEIGNPQAVDAARVHVGWRRLELHDSQLRQPGDLQLDLSAIAKGHAADAITRSLQQNGIDHALVEVGGELRASGLKPDGSPWRVAIEDAVDDDLPRVIALRDQGVATSGDRWHYNDLADRRIAHTLDPREGAPVTCTPMTVTVIADSAMLADGWATAMRVLGPERGARLAHAHALAVRFHWLENDLPREQMSEAFQLLLAA